MGGLSKRLRKLHINPSPLSPVPPVLLTPMDIARLDQEVGMMQLDAGWQPSRGSWQPLVGPPPTLPLMGPRVPLVEDPMDLESRLPPLLDLLDQGPEPADLPFLTLQYPHQPGWTDWSAWDSL